MGKTSLEENNLVAWLADEIRLRLGAGWDVDLLPWKPGPIGADRLAEIGAPDGTRATLLIDVQLQPTSATAMRTAQSYERAAAARPGVSRAMLVAPYLGLRVREECRRLGVAYADRTGALFLKIARPSIDWDRPGATKNPAPEARGLASLHGRSTARVLRTLVDRRPPFSLGDLARRARVGSPTAYKVLALLEGEGVVERGPRGAVLAVDWKGLLLRWAQDYRLEKQNVARAYLAPRGVQQVVRRLRAEAAGAAGAGLRWAVTGAWAARSEFDSLAAARLLVYADQPGRLVELLDLRPLSGPGSNVTVLTPQDERLFEECVPRDGLWYAPWSQVAIDMLGGSDREPSAGENLLAWMEINEDRWRPARGSDDSAP